MRILLDTCVWGPAQVELKAGGHDVIWAGDWDTDPGDEEILGLAFAQGRVLVTLDVWLSVLKSHYEELKSGAIITAESGRLRIREGWQIFFYDSCGRNFQVSGSGKRIAHCNAIQQLGRLVLRSPFLATELMNNGPKMGPKLPESSVKYDNKQIEMIENARADKVS